MKRSFFISLENLKFYFNFSFRNCCYDSNMKSKRVGGVGPKWYNSIKYQFRKRDVMNQSHILIVEDERDIAVAIEAYLTNQGYKVSIAGNGIEALEIVESTVIDLAIVDVMMPRMDGWQVCREVRQSSKVPIIMLTARSEERDELQGFDLGVDEYISKPFSPKILVARVNAILRRANVIGESNEINAGGIVIDKAAHQVKIDDKEIELSFKEFELLTYFVENQGIALSREKILNNVWDYDYFGDARTIDTHVKKLRSKLGEKGNYIKTIWGMGYKFEVDEE